MSTAREIMHVGAECVRPDESLSAASAKMRDLHVGALPISDAGDQLYGIITDRDIVVRCLAEGLDPQTTTAQDVARGMPIAVDAGSDIPAVLRTMEQNKIRRLPVMDNGRLAGMISEADVATQLGQNEVGEFSSAVYSAPPNN
jgi:CBS domain-containing protein